MLHFILYISYCIYFLQLIIYYKLYFMFIHHILYIIFYSSYIIYHILSIILYIIFVHHIFYMIYTPPNFSRCLFKHQPPIQQKTLGSWKWPHFSPINTDSPRSAIRVLWQEALYRAVKHCLVTFLGQDPRFAWFDQLGGFPWGFLKGGGYQPGSPFGGFELVGFR